MDSSIPAKPTILIEPNFTIFKVDHKDLIVKSTLAGPQTITYRSEIGSQTVSLKAFPYHKDRQNPLYCNAKKAKSLQHPNIAQIFDSLDLRCQQVNQIICKESYILYESTPFQDFLDLPGSVTFTSDEALCRTFFKQLIEGLECIHKNQLSHTKLNPESLLLGLDGRLKITNFENMIQKSNPKGNQGYIVEGAENFRAPEIQKIAVSDLEAIDVYSAGIIIFNLMAGHLPYLEDEVIFDFDMQELFLNEDRTEFWKVLSEYSDTVANFSEDFKKLIDGMTHPNPKKRMDIWGIKRSNWYNGQTYSQSKIESLLISKYTKIKSF